MKPILFNTDMVRAILADRKTVTRRVVKPQPRYPLAQMPLGTHKGEWHEYNESSLKDPTITSPWGYQYTPPYRLGDILYVRETWQHGFGGAYLYKADAGHDLFMTPNGELVSDIPWRPSIHMPREAARIFLRVTDVRVERLQDMPVLDIAFEGFRRQRDFIKLWNSTIKPAECVLYGWDANPWVWVIGFERVSRKEAMGNA